MPLFATFLTASFRQGAQQGTTTYAHFTSASGEGDAQKQTMARVAEVSKPGRTYADRPSDAVSMEAPAWMLRQAQEPGKSLYMVGVTTTIPVAGFGDAVDYQARFAVANDFKSAQAKVENDVRREYRDVRKVESLTVQAPAEMVAKAYQEWERAQGRAPEREAQQTSQSRQSTQQRALDVKDYSQKVIDTYRSNLRGMADVASAKAAAIYGHAKRVADQGLSSMRDAAAVASTTIKSYDTARAKGIDPQIARQQTAQAMAQRYDAQGRDTQRRERQLSQGMSR